MSTIYWAAKYKYVIQQLNDNNIYVEFMTPEEQTSFEYHLTRICNNIYEQIGSSLLEKVYQDILYSELSSFYSSKYIIKYEEDVHILYNNEIRATKRMDITIYRINSPNSLSSLNSIVPIAILELKSTSLLEPCQLSHYMKLTKCKLGYLINFEKKNTYPIEYVKNIQIYDIVKHKNMAYKYNGPKVNILRFTTKSKDYIDPEDVIDVEETSVDTTTIIGAAVPEKNNKRWASSDDQLLIGQMNDRLKLEDICRDLRRTEGSIIARTLKLKIFETKDEVLNHFRSL